MERDLAVTDAAQERVVRLLGQDLNATMGSQHEGLAPAKASRLREFIDVPEPYTQRVVDDTQQDVHDFFVDTTWPRCPHHHRHPLWFRDNAWRCEEDGVRVASQGELAQRKG